MDPNRRRLLQAAMLLQPLLAELAFVGGSVTGLYITDSGAGSPRATYDVDVIAEIATYREYEELSERLRELGLHEDVREGAPLCRWIRGESVIDVMPAGANVLGFTNRWYRDSLRRADWTSLTNDVAIRLIPPPLFVATKLEAYRGRGYRDYSGSHDLEDVITVVDGRAELTSEVRTESLELRDFIQREVAELLRSSRFLDALPGYLLPDQAS